MWSGIQFAVINLYCARHVPIPDEGRVDGVTIRTVKPGELSRFEQLHNQLRPGKRFSGWRRWTYRRLGSRLLWVCETAAGEFVGLNMYYFREGEWRNQIVHSAFNGVLENYRRRGLSNGMRAAAAANFTGGGVRGISTLIDRRNVPSWRAAQRQGFREVAAQPDGKSLLIRVLGDGRGIP